MSYVPDESRVSAMAAATGVPVEALQARVDQIAAAKREREAPAPEISDGALTKRVAELIGAGIEVHYWPHHCGVALDGACRECRRIGEKIAPVVVAAALPSCEAEVRRKVAAEIDRLYATEVPGCACPDSARSCGYRAGIGAAADAVRGGTS